MDLLDFYPSPNDLVASELSVLDYLRNNTYINENHPQVAIDAHTCYPSNKVSRSGFKFHSYFDISNESMRGHQAALRGQEKSQSNARLIVSALIERKKNAFTNVSYCLSICRIESALPPAKLTILRKFHFDVAIVSDAAGRRRLPHPRCHLQYCGEMYPYMEKVGCSGIQLEEMHPWLSEPRIFFWPMSLAILIDMALHEFPDQRSVKFREDSYWRHLVLDQERLILRPFYEKCVEIITDVKGEKRTLADAFYIS